MNEDGRTHDLDCARAVRYVHQRLDGDALFAFAVEQVTTLVALHPHASQRG